ncbi:hypothetical protein EPN96_02980 [bacterium]|nr:MAG: hypothetical protein EPN96_02980 [bacterium]
MKHAVIGVLLALTASTAFCDPGIYPERRRLQYSNDSGYAIFPYVFDLPGIGSGYGVLGATTNVGGSTTDLMGTFFAGDVDGEALGINSVELVKERLILDLGAAHLSNATIQSYAKRGMDTEKNDYVLAELGDSVFGGSRLTATFADRRFEVYLGYYAGTTRLSAVRDRDGDVIIEAEGTPKEHITTAIYGARVDLTDDYTDPRRGLRLESSYWHNPPRDSGPDFYFIDFNATGYLPLGKRSTWVLNYFRSDAYVISKGETDPAVIADEQGLDCGSITDLSDRQECEQYIDNIVAENTFGTATALGGYGRLRAYPEGRYRGAHAEFIGNELRWNLTDERTPFNIFIMKDIRTAIQIAFFYEIGSVADLRSDLWDISRSAYGTGIRLVTGSGLIYRVDLATGHEGFQPSVFFQYPWEM